MSRVFTEVLDSGWSEDTVTWDNAPAADGVALGALGPVSSDNWYELDVTPLVTGDGAVSVGVSSTNSNGADYVSRNGSPGLAPELVIQLG